MSDSTCASVCIPSHLRRWSCHGYSAARVQLERRWCLCSADGTEWQRRIERSAEAWTDLSAESAGEAAAAINRHGVHVLVDLSGLIRTATQVVLALRPAAVQVRMRIAWDRDGGAVGVVPAHEGRDDREGSDLNQWRLVGANRDGWQVSHLGWLGPTCGGAGGYIDVAVGDRVVRSLWRLVRGMRRTVVG
jgi:hypothetical protein